LRIGFYGDVLLQVKGTRNYDVWAMMLCDWHYGWEQGCAGLIIIPMDAEKVTWARLGMWNVEYEWSGDRPTLKTDPELEDVKTIVLI
jgi:hypothetical protein